MTPSERNAILRQRLREGDPLADGKGLSAAEAQAIRRQILAAAPAAHRPLAWRFAFAAIALVATLTGAHFLTPRTLDTPQIEVAHSSSGGAGHLDDEDSRDRQVQFVTRGGTRIIWMLKPRID